MDKIMNVELSGKGDTYATVTLPLTPYEMLDTLDKLRMTPQDEPDWEICGFLAHRELHDWIGNGSIYELNLLAERCLAFVVNTDDLLTDSRSAARYDSRLGNGGA